MKIFRKIIGFAFLLGFAQASLASIDPCSLVTELKGRVDKTNAAIASGSIGQLEAATKDLGIAIPAGGEAAIKKLLQYEEGMLYKSLQVSQAGCDNQREIARQAEIAKQKAEQLAWDIAHALHRQCGMYDHGAQRHFACRMIR